MGKLRILIVTFLFIAANWQYGSTCAPKVQQIADGVNLNPEFECHAGWFKSGRHCYQLLMVSSNDFDSANKSCTKLSQEADLPVFADEDDWHDIMHKSAIFERNEVKFWLDLVARRSEDHSWEWDDRIPLTYANWVAPPSEIQFEKVDDSQDWCAYGWAQKSSQQTGWLETKCVANAKLGDVATICQIDPNFTAKKKEWPNSSERLTVKEVSQKFRGAHLKNGKRISMAVTENDLKKQTDLINKANEELARKMGFTGPIARVTTPVRGDLFETAEDLQEDIDEIEDKPNRKKRAATKHGITRWPHSQAIYYAFDEGFGANGQHHKVFEEAIAFWQNHTCFDFVNSDENPDVLLMDGGSCFSLVGRAPFKKPQPLSLGDGCDTLAIATHEIGHLMGLDHEQSRVDRQKYVDVYINSINTSYLDNFRTCCDCQELARTQRPYDYGSVMHYSPIEFAIDPEDETILPTDSDYWWTIGTSHDPTFLDVKTVNDFQCRSKCSGTANKCRNGGYPHPRNCRICICPTGFGGAVCADFKDFDGSNCGHSKTLSNGHFHNFSTPNYPRVMPDVSCAWLFKAPKGKVVELNFEEFFDLPEDCTHGYVEIKNELDMTPTGKRFCGETAPKNYTSKGDTMIVLVRKFGTTAKRHGFGATVRAIAGGNHTVAKRPKRESSTTLINKAIANEQKSHHLCAKIIGATRNRGPSGLTLKVEI